MKWQTVIGLEVHVELLTKTKLFCSCSASFGDKPNSHCCPICTGMPGVLPVLNARVLEYAVKAGLALNCTINQHNQFDRKNYFYPDLPKAYQISQLYVPYAQNGAVSIKTQDGSDKTIRIHEIHIEEDAGKLIHSEERGVTYLDYNRCGIPLIEIVSEPDFEDAHEVLQYLTKIKSCFEYLDISDCKMEEGSIRVDVNISVKEAGSSALGTRTEIKNLNSFKAITQAIAYERKRQIALLERGEQVVQETRRWDDKQERTVGMRSKENANDYRYFPEPDIPPVTIDDGTLQAYRDSLPEFAEQKVDRYISDFHLAHADAEIIANSKYLAALFEQTVDMTKDANEVRYWIITEILYFVNERKLELSHLHLDVSLFAAFIACIKEGRLNRQVGKQVFEKMVFEKTFDLESYIKDNHLEQVNNDAVILQTVQEVFDQHPEAIRQYLQGEEKIVGFFIGQTMKKLGGTANPKVVRTTVMKMLSETTRAQEE